MDLNLVVLAGRLAAPPERRLFDSGAAQLRYLVTIRSTEPRRRIDVVPVTIWDTTQDEPLADPEPGARLWVAGAVQRRFWNGGESRRSRLEIVAHQIEFRDASDPEGSEVA